MPARSAACGLMGDGKPSAERLLSSGMTAHEKSSTAKLDCIAERWWQAPSSSHTRGLVRLPSTTRLAGTTKTARRRSLCVRITTAARPKGRRLILEMQVGKAKALAIEEWAWRLSEHHPGWAKRRKALSLAQTPWIARFPNLHRLDTRVMTPRSKGYKMHQAFRSLAARRHPRHQLHSLTTLLPHLKRQAGLSVECQYPTHQRHLPHPQQLLQLPSRSCLRRHHHLLHLQLLRGLSNRHLRKP